MASVPIQPVGASAKPERRRHTRRRLDQLAYVAFGPDSGGILVEISEEGLRCQIVGSFTTGQRCHMKFLLPGRHAALEADGEIAWTNASGQGGGVRFVGMRPEDREDLLQWILDDILATAKGRLTPIPFRPRRPGTGIPVKPAVETAVEPIGASAETAIQPVEEPLQAAVAAAPEPKPLSRSAARKLARAKRGKAATRSAVTLSLPLAERKAPLLAKIAVLIVFLIIAAAAFAAAPEFRPIMDRMPGSNLPVKVVYGSTPAPLPSSPPAPSVPEYLLEPTNDQSASMIVVN